MKRISWIDFLKGLLIFLVLLGHCIQDIRIITVGLGHIYSWIYYFHMAAFFFVSGILTDFDKKIDIKCYVKSKARRLLIPAYAYIPFVVLSNIIGKIAIDTDVKSVFKTCLLMRGGSIQNLWFFPAMFSACVVVLPLYCFLKQTRYRIAYMIALLAGSAIWITSINVPLPLFFEVGVFGASFIILGNVLNKLIITNRKKVLICISIIGVIIQGVVFVKELPFIEFYCLHISNPIRYFVNVSIVILSIVCIVKFIYDRCRLKEFKLFSVFEKAGLYSDKIYGTHWILVGFGRWLFGQIPISNSILGTMIVLIYSVVSFWILVLLIESLFPKSK